MTQIQDTLKESILHNIPKGKEGVVGGVKLRTYYYRGIETADLGDDAETVQGYMYSFVLRGDSQTEESVYYDDEREAREKCIQIAEKRLSLALVAIRRRMKTKKIERI